jgi:hypothetical protein
LCSNIGRALKAILNEDKELTAYFEEDSQEFDLIEQPLRSQNIINETSNPSNGYNSQDNLFEYENIHEQD